MLLTRALLDTRPTGVVSYRATTIAWRSLVGLSVVINAVRGVVVEAGASVVGVQLVQFGTIALAAVVVFLGPRLGTLPRRSVWLALALALFVVVSFVGSMFSVDPPSSLASSGLTLVMFGFLAVTATWRWRDSSVHAFADLRFLVIVHGVLLFAGLALAGLGYSDAVGEYSRLTGLYSNANYAGVVGAITLVLACCLLGSLPRWLTVALVATMAISAATVLLSGSRTAIIAAAVGLTVSIAVRLPSLWSRALAAMVGVSICAAAVFVPVALLRGESSLPSDFDPNVTPSQEATEPADVPQVGTSGSPDSAPEGSGGTPASTPTPDDSVGAPPTEIEASSPSRRPDSDTGTDTEDDNPDTIGTINDQTSGRLEIALRSLAAFAEAPFLGTGLGTASVVLDGVETHNFPLQVLLETGLLGALSLSVVLALLIVVLVYSRPPPLLTGAALAIGVVEMALSSMLGWGGPTALLFWLVVVALCTTSPLVRPASGEVKPTTK